MASINIDDSLCTGCGLCASNFPEMFEIGDDNIAHVVAKSSSGDLKALDRLGVSEPCQRERLAHTGECLAHKIRTFENHTTHPFFRLRSASDVLRCALIESQLDWDGSECSPVPRGRTKADCSDSLRGKGPTRRTCG